jgi:hypothetical protein
MVYREFKILLVAQNTNTAWSGANKIGKNASKCKLKMLSAKKECLEKSESYEAFRSCMAQFKEQRRQEMREMKQN